MKTKHLIFSLLAMFASFSAKAANGDTFTVSIGDGNSRMTLKVLSEANRTVEVSSVSDNDVTAATIASTYTNDETEYTVVSIGNFAFLDKDNLIELNLPNTLTHIGLKAFKGCTALGSQDHTLIIPSSVTTIEADAFNGCGFFAGPIPTNVTSIGPDAFEGTNWLQNQPDGIVYINNMVYTYKGTMPASSSLTVAEGTTRIINDAFKNQENLVAITLPSTLTAVESYAFSGCNNLASVTVNATTPPTCPADAFSNAANATLNVPSGTMVTYKAATGWKSLKQIIDPANIVFEDANVKEICVKAWNANWDTNGDGELSYAEAAAVTSLGTYFNSKTNITKFNEFKYFTGLTSLGGEAQSYTTNGFYGCTALTEISIPSNVTVIGYRAFENCSALTKAEFASIEHLCNIEFKHYYSTPLTYAKHLYIDGSEVTEVVIPNSVTEIGVYTFYNCKDITSVTFHNNVTSIGNAAFSGCGLTSVSIPNSVTSIGSSAFSYCSNLSSVTVPSSVTSIGAGAFSNSGTGTICILKSSTPVSYNSFGARLYIVPDEAVDAYKTAWPDLADKIFGESEYAFKSYTITAKASSSALLEAIGGEEYTSRIIRLKVSGTINSYDMMIMATKMINLLDIDLSDATIVANSYNYGTGVSEDNVFPDFLRNKYLSSIVLPNSITTIGNNAFKGDGNTGDPKITAGTSIVIPASVTSIGNSAFEYSSFSSIEFAPQSQLSSIGTYAFSKNYNIRSFNAPSSLTSLGNNAFYNCTSLTTATLPAATIGNNAFKGCTSLTTVTLQNGVTTIGANAFETCTALNSLTLPTEGLTSIGDYAFNGCSALSNIELPQGLTSVGQYAFQNCTSLASAIIHEGVTSIGNYAFSGCRVLPNITLPQSLTTLGQCAFSGCTKLENITIPSVKTIAQSTFNGCTILSEVKLSPQTTTIEQYAFTNCYALTEIHLPPFLNTIGNKAFSGCGNLMTIYAYMPDIITIGSSTFPNMASATLYVPAFLYNNYYYDINWKNFLHVLPCDLQPGDYAAFYTNGDIIFGEGEQRITQDTPIAEIGTQGGIIVEGEAQQFDTVDQTVGDYSSSSATSASLIGDGETAQANNLPMSELRVKLTVQAKKWYFFCFPFDVTIEQCEYPGRYVWRYYDGAIRAANGSGGWQPVTGETLTARQGYAFQSETSGTLVVKFNHPTFGGDRVKELVAHATSNAANASWNFIGNPYSSYYDFRSEDITSPITIWNGSSYVAYRPGDDECHLKPYQAFFVQKPTASVQVTFNVQRRETYRQSEVTKAARMNARRKQGISPKRRLINLEIMSDTVMLDRTRVVLNPEAASAYELEYDAAKFLSDDSKAQIYSVENGIQMAINERPLAGDIRLGYTAKKAGRLSISAPRMDIPMVLVDMKLGITFDLTLGTYDFDTSAGTFNDRFLLRQGSDATAINNLTAKTGVCFGTQDGGIAIGGAEGKHINVYTTGGAEVASHTGNGFVALKSGIYVVSVDGVTAKVSVK